MTRYNPSELEPKWQKIWDETKLYEVSEDPSKKKIYATPMLPYPSGSGLHIGHGRNYSIADVVARFYRQRGHNVMSNMGWDAFGLPAENYAIKTGITPQQAVKDNAKTFKGQLKRFGMSYDWSREINTTDPEYYKWTQWIFTQLFENDLAYQGTSQQWWCEKCKTVLANEQVVDGRCWRHDSPDDPLVTRRETKQWFFKITDYADELLEETDALDWPQGIKTAQKNWIGRSVGAEVDFAVDGTKDTITVFTTRPDTLFGATYMVLAPEHPLVSKITSKEQQEQVEEYVETAAQKSDLQRKQDEKHKTGVFTGAYATNPVNDEKIPVWIADYVLMGYGTGAIMAVPAHDERDFEFAKKFDLPIINVVEREVGKPAGDDIDKPSVFVALLDKSGENILTLDWGPRQERHGGNMLIGGTIEGSETPLEAAKREVIEETGYVSFDLVEQTDFSSHVYHYSNTKQKNMKASGAGYLFKLTSEDKQDTQLDDGKKNKFKLVWQKVGPLPGYFGDEAHQGFYDYFTQGRIHTGEGVMANSGQYSGMNSSDARDKIVADLEKAGKAKEKVNYKLRDWLISRQRYWGAPIPIIHCEECGSVAVPEKDLPVVLPVVKDFKPTGKGTSVLADAEDWVNVSCPDCGGKAKRETDTMDGYACSSWYMYRYADANNNKAAWDKDKVDYWLPVDFYFGGDHAVSHLLYFRFWHKFFVDQGFISAESREPVKKLVYNGLINAEDGRKMSKSYGNVIDPLDIIDSGYGADALRMYELFIAPYDQDAAWSSKGVPGMYRYLNRLWDFALEFMEAEPAKTDSATDSELETAVMAVTHRAIKKVTEDLEDLSFNTAIAAQMKLNNQLRELKEQLPFAEAKETWREALSISLQLLAPFAPHITEELWSQLGYEESIHVDGWPVWDEELIKEELTTIVVQVNGKLRAQLQLPAEVSEDDMVQAAKQDEKVATYLKDGEVVKTITVPGKLVNFVVKS